MRHLPLTLTALVSLVCTRAITCPLCENALQLTISAQELIYAEHSVLAMPAAEGNEFRVVTIIKGDAPPGNTITGSVYKADAAAMQSQKPLLLIRDDDWIRWVNFGPVGADQADWLRQLSRTKRTIGLTGAEWREQVAYFLPYLENPEPMVAEIAYNEFVSAPLDALRSLKPRLKVEAIRKWLSDPKLAARQPVYVLLLGVAGNEQDARWIDERIAAAYKTHDTTNLAALIGALVELRGPSSIEKSYLTDKTRTKSEIEAALLALQVQGVTNDLTASR
jgi:hypothetical protein